MAFGSFRKKEENKQPIYQLDIEIPKKYWNSHEIHKLDSQYLENLLKKDY